MYQVNINEATGRLAELVEAAIRGEVVYITKDGQETVQLVPVQRNHGPLLVVPEALSRCLRILMNL